MLTQNPNSWGSLQHDEPTHQFVVREADETGGLGFDSDYGQGMAEFVRAADEAAEARQETAHEKCQALGDAATSNQVERSE